MVTSTTNCHAAFISPSVWSMHSTQQHGIGPGVCRKEGVSLECTRTH